MMMMLTLTNRRQEIESAGKSRGLQRHTGTRACLHGVESVFLHATLEPPPARRRRHRHWPLSSTTHSKQKGVQRVHDVHPRRASRAYVLPCSA